MARALKPVNLEKAFAKLLEKYVEEVDAVVVASGHAVAKSTVRNLKILGKYKDRSGRYRRSFRYKQFSDYAGTKFVVYAVKPGRRIGHLVEKGTMAARAFPHWKPAEEIAQADFERLLTENIPKI